MGFYESIQETLKQAWENFRKTEEEYRAKVIESRKAETAKKRKISALSKRLSEFKIDYLGIEAGHNKALRKFAARRIRLRKLEKSTDTADEFQLKSEGINREEEAEKARIQETLSQAMTAIRELDLSIQEETLGLLEEQQNLMMLLRSPLSTFSAEVNSIKQAVDLSLAALASTPAPGYRAVEGLRAKIKQAAGDVIIPGQGIGFSSLTIEDAKKLRFNSLIPIKHLAELQEVIEEAEREGAAGFDSLRLQAAGVMTPEDGWTFMYTMEASK